MRKVLSLLGLSLLFGCNASEPTDYRFTLVMESLGHRPLPDFSIYKFRDGNVVCYTATEPGVGPPALSCVVSPEEVRNGK